MQGSPPEGREGQDMERMDAHPPASPSPSPRASLSGYTRGLPTTPNMQRSKRSSSRMTDGATSRASDEDAKTAVKVGMRLVLTSVTSDSILKHAC